MLMALGVSNILSSKSTDFWSQQKPNPNQKVAWIATASSEKQMFELNVASNGSKPFSVIFE